MCNYTSAHPLNSLMNIKRPICSIALCCFLLTLVLTASAQASVNFRLYPASNISSEDGYFAYAAQAGTTIEDSVALRNVSNQPVRLQLFPADAMTASSGSVTAKTGWDDVPQAGGAWLDLTSQVVELAAEEERIIPFALIVPDETPAGEYAASIVAQLADSTENVTGIQFIPRFAVTVMTTVAGAEPLEARLEVGGISAETGRTSHTLITQLHNSGNDGINRVTGQLTVTDMNQQTVVTEPIQLGYFLAGDTLNYRSDLGQLPAGDYNATFVAQYNDQEVIQTETFSLAAREPIAILPQATETIAIVVEPPPTMVPTPLPLPTISSITPSAIAEINTINTETEEKAVSSTSSAAIQKDNRLIIGLVLSISLSFIALIATLFIVARATRRD